MDNNNLPTRAEFRRSKKHDKKRFYKRWWFWSIIFILLLAGGGVAGMKMTSTGPFKPATVKVSKKKTTSKKKKAKQSGITLAQYNGVYLSETDGLSLDSLEKIFGKPANSTAGTIQNINTDMNTWSKVANSQLGSTVIINFANGHAIGKSINGLKVSRPSKIGLNEYNKIQNNQSESELFNLVGKPNGYSEITVSGTTTNTLTYSSGIKGQVGSNFIINLKDGVVSGKSQTGLE